MSPDEQQFRPVGAATPVVEATAGVVSAAVLGTASAVRRARIFHPDGVAFEATLDVAGGSHGAPLLDVAARHDAVVRLSRAVGLPRSVPDILGLAIRICDAHGPDRHQDLLTVTSSTRRILRHLLVPASGFDHERWSTLLPYRLGDRRVVLGARRINTRTRRRIRLDDLDHRGAAGEGIRFSLDVAAISGPWEPFGVLTLGERLPDATAEAIGFDPANTGGGIEPVGFLQALRRLSYRTSQAARPS